MNDAHSTARTGVGGTIVSVGASVLFGALYFVTPMLAPLSAESIWAFRSALTLPAITLVLFAMRSGWLITEIGQRIRRRPILLLGILVTGALLSAQVWVFSWAPLHGRALQVALGYFLLPLVLVVIGKFLYKDRLAWWQWCAAGIALIGVVYEIVRVGSISWETLLVALGYPCYFVLRRSLGMNHLGGMWWEMLVALPFAVVVIILEVMRGSALAAQPALWWAAPVFGLAAGFAMLFYVLASRLLSLSVFGLLSYLEPALLVVASVLIGERIASGEWFTYGAIWAAVLVLIVGGIATLRRPPRRPPRLPPNAPPISTTD